MPELPYLQTRVYGKCYSVVEVDLYNIDVTWDWCVFCEVDVLY